MVFSAFSGIQIIVCRADEILLAGENINRNLAGIGNL